MTYSSVLYLNNNKKNNSFKKLLKLVGTSRYDSKN